MRNSDCGIKIHDPNSARFRLGLTVAVTQLDSVLVDRLYESRNNNHR